MNRALCIVPRPRKLRAGRGGVNSTARELLLDPAWSARLKKALLRELPPGFRISVAPRRGKPPADTFLQINPRKGLPPQGYRIQPVASGGLCLEAADEAGAFYGWQTFLQAWQQGNGQVVGLRVEDHPDLADRGLMLDISRCKVPTLETLYFLIDRMAALKLNQLQLYTEHTFSFRDHETVWRESSPLTPEDILRLDAYCHARYIELVPNFNSFGHWERWLRHPEYRSYANCPDGHPNPWGGGLDHGTVLKPHRASLRLLDQLFGELLPQFQSTRFNVGCDETWELGHGWSQKICQERGTHRVYLDHLKAVHKLAAGHGRTVQFWGDIIDKAPEFIPELPSDSCALSWGYEARHPFARECRQLAGAGIPFYVCPGTSSWNSLCGRTSNMLANQRNALRNGLRYGATGYLNTDWGDGGHHQALPISYPGFAAGAAMAWGYERNRNLAAADAANVAFFQDPSGSTAQLFDELGRVCELIREPFCNSTAFNHLLFHNPKAPSEALLRLKPTELEAALSALNRLDEASVDMHPGGEDAAHLRAEFCHMIDLARLGVRRGLKLHGGNEARCAIVRDIYRSIENHLELWLARNRPGGLNESLNRLRGAAKYSGG